MASELAADADCERARRDGGYGGREHGGFVERAVALAGNGAKNARKSYKGAFGKKCCTCSIFDVSRQKIGKNCAHVKHFVIL